MTDLAARPVDTEVEDEALIEGLHAFIAKEVMPIQDAIGDLYENPRLFYREDGREAQAVTDARRRARELSARAGYYTMFCPTEFGGGDLGIRQWFLCWESLFHQYGAPVTQLPYFVLSHFTGGPHEVWKHASTDLKEEVIPGLTAGTLQGCFGLTEPNAGSDSWAMQTTAVRDANDWIINGTKQWITWAPSADFVMVYAVTNKELLDARKGGVTCFYVPTSSPGYRLDSVVPIFGHLGGDEGILSFTDVRVPDTYRVGEVDRGYDLAMLGIRHGRLANAGRCLGLARWAMDKAIEYAKVRRTFGKPLAEHQTIQNYLAESTIALYAIRTMALDCSRKADAGRDVRTEVAAVKVFATRAAFEVIDRCMQIHGGMGIANETKLVEAWFNARTTHIVEGANEIQLRSIANNLLKGRVDLSFK